MRGPLHCIEVGWGGEEANDYGFVGLRRVAIGTAMQARVGVAGEVECRRNGSGGVGRNQAEVEDSGDAKAKRERNTSGLWFGGVGGKSVVPLYMMRHLLGRSGDGLVDFSISPRTRSKTLAAKANERRSASEEWYSKKPGARR